MNDVEELNKLTDRAIKWWLKHMDTDMTEQIIQEYQDNMEIEGLNVCDKCGVAEQTEELIWIDSEDFEPLENEKFNNAKYNNALEKGYSALSEKCYDEECCGTPDYKKGYEIMSEYFDSIADEEKEEVDRLLKECGL